MEDWEHVTTCKNLMLASQETHAGHKGFICVGTTHVYGEDITCRGRVGFSDGLTYCKNKNKKTHCHITGIQAIFIEFPLNNSFKSLDNIRILLRIVQ